jgi:acetyl-CoA acetyltransferase
MVFFSAYALSELIGLPGVIPATRAVLKKANLTKDQIDVFEINEAFGSVVLAWLKDIQPNPSKVNPNGTIEVFAGNCCREVISGP